MSNSLRGGFVGSSGNWSSCCLECERWREHWSPRFSMCLLCGELMSVSLLVGAWHGFVRTFVTRVCQPLCQLTSVAQRVPLSLWTFKMSSFLRFAFFLCQFLADMMSLYLGLMSFSLPIFSVYSVLRSVFPHSERSICKKSQRPFPNINSVEVLQLIQAKVSPVLGPPAMQIWAVSSPSCWKMLLIKPSVLVIVLLFEDIVKLFCISSKAKWCLYWEFLENILCCFGLQCCGLQNWCNCSLDSFLIWSILDEAHLCYLTGYFMESSHIGCDVLLKINFL